MPITAPLHGPVVFDEPPFTPQQQDALWEAVVRNWAQQNRERFRQLLDHPEEQPAGSSGCL